MGALEVLPGLLYAVHHDVYGHANFLGGVSPDHVSGPEECVCRVYEYVSHVYIITNFIKTANLAR